MKQMTIETPAIWISCIALIICTVICLILSQINKLKDRKLAEDRHKAGYDEQNVILQLAEQGIPGEIAIPTIKFLQEIWWVKNFPFLPDDKLRRGMNSWEEEHWDAAISELCKRCARKADSKQNNYDHIITVADLALYIELIR